MHEIFEKGCQRAFPQDSEAAMIEILSSHELCWQYEDYRYKLGGRTVLGILPCKKRNS